MGLFIYTPDSALEEYILLMELLSDRQIWGNSSLWLHEDPQSALLGVYFQDREGRPEYIALLEQDLSNLSSYLGTVQQRS